jgi:hypothetical protein
MARAIDTIFLCLGVYPTGGATRGLAGQPVADHQVLGHRQLGKDAGILRRIADAAFGAPVRRHAGDVLAVEANFTGPHGEQTHDALDDGGAPGAVAADQGDDLAVVDRQRYAVQNVRGTAEGVDGIDLEQHLVFLRLLKPTAVRREGCWRRPCSP